jgi:catechol 2,3-dioxygenase-like lactoylglutathione lyase family enzyme
MTIPPNLITKLARVLVAVNDQDRSLEFYAATLGFEKVADVAFGDGDRWVEVAPPGTPTTIALARRMDGAEAQGSMTGISFATSDIDALHDALQAAGTDVDDVMRFPPPVPPMFFFRDPDGNTLHATEG